MLEPRYVRKVELTFKSHVPITDERAEEFLVSAMIGMARTQSLGNPLRDVSVAVDDFGPIERIPD